MHISFNDAFDIVAGGGSLTETLEASNCTNSMLTFGGGRVDTSPAMQALMARLQQAMLESVVTSI